MYKRQVKFSWDDEKAAEVEREHHVELARIIEIFSDPFAVEFEDVTTPRQTRRATLLSG
jgi:uncharacterized DUF497 family protein